jgi:hypothetical protein
MFKTIRFSASLLTLVMLAACAPATVIQTFVDPSLTRSAIHSGGLTILPVSLGSQVKDANLPELRRQLSQRVGQAINNLFSDAKTVPIERTLEVLEKGNLLDNYAAASVAFDQTGLLRAQTLDQITTATETRYAVFPYLQSASQTVSSNGFFSSINSTATFSIVLWDKVSQKSVFEGTASGGASRGLFGGGLIIDAIYAASDNAIAKLKTSIK